MCSCRKKRRAQGTINTDTTTQSQPVPSGTDAVTASGNTGK